MAIFGVELYSTIPEDYIKKVSLKLKSNSLVKNPFKARIYHKNNLAVFDITPIYLNFPLYGLVIAGLITFFLGRLSWVITPFVLISTLGVLWSGRFYYLIFKWGLRKYGYKDTITRLNKDEIIRRVVKWDK